MTIQPSTLRDGRPVKPIVFVFDLGDPCDHGWLHEGFPIHGCMECLHWEAEVKLDHGRLVFTEWHALDCKLLLELEAEQLKAQAGEENTQP